MQDSGRAGYDLSIQPILGKAFIEQMTIFLPIHLYININYVIGLGTNAGNKEVFSYLKGLHLILLTHSDNFGFLNVKPKIEIKRIKFLGAYKKYLLHIILKSTGKLILSILLLFCIFKCSNKTYLIISLVMYGYRYSSLYLIFLSADLVSVYPPALGGQICLYFKR